MLALAKFICNVDSSRINEAVSLYESARNAGVQPDLEMEPKLGSMLDERRDLASFLTDAAREAEKSKDWRSAAWYYRQLVEMDWNPVLTVAQLAFARHMADDPGALEAIEFAGKKTPLNQLVMVLIELKNQNQTAAMASAKLAKHLNGDKKVIIPLEIPNLAIELNIAVSKCPENLRTELLKNFSLEVGENKISVTPGKQLDK